MEQKGGPGPATVKGPRRVSIGDGLGPGGPGLPHVQFCEEAVAACWSPTHPGPTISAGLKGPKPRAFAQAA